jgi:hypothetical protein
MSFEIKYKGQDCKICPGGRDIVGERKESAVDEGG